VISGRLYPTQQNICCLVRFDRWFAEKEAEVKKREAMNRRSKIPTRIRNRRKKRQEPFLGRVEVDDRSPNRTDDEDEETKEEQQRYPRPPPFPSLVC